MDTYPKIETIKLIAKRISDCDGDAYFVGGCVRDKFLRKPINDIDIVVVGIGMETLLAILHDFGTTKNTGREFLVTKLDLDGFEFDFAIARKEISTGDGYHDIISESGTLLEDLYRRDITMNAIAIHILTGETIDPFNGLEDIYRGIIRHVSKEFTRSSERPFRLSQIAARNPDMIIHHTTIDVCRGMVDTFETIPTSQLKQQFEKMFCKGIKPSMGLFALKLMGYDRCLIGLSELVGLQQDEEFHPEGDVFTHTLNTIDAMVAICRREQIKGQRRLKLVLAAYLHDFGKATTTVVHDNGRITSRGHDKETESAVKFMEQIGIHQDMIRAIVALIEEHMVTASLRFSNKDVTPRLVRRLARRLHEGTRGATDDRGSATIDDLCFLIEADLSGRFAGITKPIGQIGEIAKLRELSIKANVINEKPSTILTGKHLISLGLQPGPVFGRILRAAALEEDEGSITTVDDAISFARQMIASL